MAENKAPPSDTFCAKAPEQVENPAIHFPGGQILQGQIDPTRGFPTVCSLSINLVDKLDAALAPLQPLYTILDLVAQTAQCTLIISQMVTNPLKFLDFIKCAPGFITKLNAVLALIPPLPEGIVEIVTFVVDVLRFVGTEIGCVTSLLRSISTQLHTLADQLNRASLLEDDVLRQSLLDQVACGQTTVEQSTGQALAALGPIARILCTVRSILALTGDKGREIAKRLKFPDVTNIAVLDDAIAALELLKTVILDTVIVVEAIALPFGGLLPPPDIGFHCQLDDESDSTASAPPPPATPSILSVTPPTVPHGSADLTVTILGTGFEPGSQVFFNAAPLAVSLVLTDGTQIQAKIPATLLRNPATYYIVVANAPAGAGSPFQGIQSSSGSGGASGVETSEQVQFVVT